MEDINDINRQMAGLSVYNDDEQMDVDPDFSTNETFSQGNPSTTNSNQQQPTDSGYLDFLTELSKPTVSESASGPASVVRYTLKENPDDVHYAVVDHQGKIGYWRREELGRYFASLKGSDGKSTEVSWCNTYFEISENDPLPRTQTEAQVRANEMSSRSAQSTMSNASRTSTAVLSLRNQGG